MSVLFLPLLLLAAPANTAPSSVAITSELVCEVQHAIRYRQAPWAPWECLRIADAVNAAARATKQRADTLLAIAINESDLRPGAQHWTDTRWRFLPGGKYVYEGIGPGSIGDLGLMGTRCKLGPDMHCSNGKLRGMKYPQAMVIETNIMLGARILAAKPTLHDYNGSEEYAPRIRAIRSALAGIEVDSPSPRVRKLISQIVSAVRRLQNRS
jgi:hypothetical protein